jgi:hypothetical protein
MPDDLLAKMGGDEFLVRTLPKADAGKGGKGTAEDAF